MKFSPAHQTIVRFVTALVITTSVIAGFGTYHLQANAASLLESPLTPPVTPPTTPPVTPPEPTPTPPPANTAPRWLPLLNWLPTGRIGQLYKTELWAIDRDLDQLQTTITGVPAGLVAQCMEITPGRNMCVLVGRPTTRGLFAITAQATDSHGATTSQQYYMLVW